MALNLNKLEILIIYALLKDLRGHYINDRVVMDVEDAEKLEALFKKVEDYLTQEE